jgi:hypothetical protein
MVVPDLFNSFALNHYGIQRYVDFLNFAQNISLAYYMESIIIIMLVNKKWQYSEILVRFVYLVGDKPYKYSELAIS